MEREVGRGIGIGNTCKPMAVSFQCMTKSTTKKKKINQLDTMCFLMEIPSDSKEFACNAGDLDMISGSGRLPGEGNGYSSILAWRIP